MMLEEKKLGFFNVVTVVKWWRSRGVGGMLNYDSLLVRLSDVCTDTLLRKCLNYTKFSATVCYHHTVSFFSLDVQLYLYWCIVIGSSKELSIDICWVQVAITIENTKIKDHVTNRCTFAVEYTNEPSKLFLNLACRSHFYTNANFVKTCIF